MSARPFFRLLCASGAVLLLGCGSLRAEPVAILGGGRFSEPGDRSFVTALASHLLRWYREAGVEVCWMEDRDPEMVLQDARLAILVCVSRTNPSLLHALRDFGDRGGKTIVFYSTSPALASLLGFRAVRYLRGSSDGCWSSMHFVDGRPEGVPSVVRQRSPNLFLVEPVAGRSSVLAWWHDREGMQTEQPAWLRSRSAFWMTHVLTADGDVEAKRQLLLALAVAAEPDLAVPAVRKVLGQTRELVDRVGREVVRAGRTSDPAFSYRLVVFSNSCAKAEAAVDAGDVWAAWHGAAELSMTAAEIYGRLQRPRTGEIRAVWEVSGLGLHPDNWPQTIGELENAGITDLFVDVAGAGYSHFANGVLPRSRVFEEHGDQLEACVKAAAGRGIRVHAWMRCFTTEGSSRERLNVFSGRGWLLADVGDGAPRWLDPESPAVCSYLLDAIGELAATPGLSGVHLDFVRWPERGSDVTMEPSRVSALTDFVRKARRRVRGIAPNALLSVAVFGDYPSCVTSVGQDWEAWIGLGLVDYVVPMDYTEDLSVFAALLGRRSQSLTNAILPGIGVTAASSRLDAIGVIDQIRTLRTAGYPGFALYDLDTTLRQDILPVLRLGITR